MPARDLCFLQFDSLSLLSPSQAAELTQDSGALESINMINLIFNHLEEGDVFQNANEFFGTLTQTQVSLSHRNYNKIMINIKEF